jgi:hypothetical protein
MDALSKINMLNNLTLIRIVVFQKTEEHLLIADWG